MRGNLPVFCPTAEAIYFPREGWTGRNALRWKAKLDFRRRRFLDPRAQVARAIAIAEETSTVSCFVREKRHKQKYSYPKYEFPSQAPDYRIFTKCTIS
jgi:hypothetical protein